MWEAEGLGPVPGTGKRVSNGLCPPAPTCWACVPALCKLPEDKAWCPVLRTLPSPQPAPLYSAVTRACAPEHEGK